jgi:TonB-dependent SusC/RagA subfamily outer membrane receptor
MTTTGTAGRAARLPTIPAALLAGFVAAACGTHTAAGTGPEPAAAETSVAAVGDVLTREQIEKIHAARMEQLFEGRFTGVQVLRRGGELTMRIRGDGEPLLVVDGVPTSSFRYLWGLNPFDIEQIEILKDAAASYYGVRGANGVVVVTTRMR